MKQGFDPERLEAEMRRVGSRAAGLDRILPRVAHDLHREQFAIAAELHELSQNIRMRCIEAASHLPLGSPKGLATLLIGRGVETFESCMMLCEHGRSMDAISAGRAIVEADILACGLSEDSDDTRAFLFEQERAGDASRAKLFRSVFSRPEDDPELEAAITKRLEELTNIKEDGATRPDLRLFAESHGVLESYYLFREFSHEGTHVGLTSLMAQAGRDQDGVINGFKVGPDPEQSGQALSKICLAMAALTYVVAHLFDWPEVREPIDALLARNKALVKV